MKISALLAVAANAAPQKFENENFVTSGVEFYLEMDNVMGGVSQARLSEKNFTKEF